MADGQVVFDTQLDTAGIKSGLSGLESTINRWGATIIGSKAFSAITDKLIDVARAGVEYNAQMEAYQTNFGVLLGNEQKALEHVAQLREMAAKTPFGMEDLASASQTLLSFGYNADRVQDSLKMLGDIALGDKQKFGSLSLAFAQISAAGKLTGQDLLQMVNAGFNPLNTIAEATGTNLGDLKEVMAGGKGSREFQKQMTAARKEVKKLGDQASEGARMLAQIGTDGMISAEMVGLAMQMETSPGGRFYNGMEKASQTMTGLWSTLKDDAMQLAGNVFSPISDALKEVVLPAAIGAVDALNGLFDGDGTVTLSVEAQEAMETVSSLDEKISGVRQKYLTEAISIQVQYDQVSSMLTQLDELSSKLKETPKNLWSEEDKTQLDSLNSQLSALLPNFQSLVGKDGLLKTDIEAVQALTEEYYNLALAKAASAALEEAYAVQIEADLEVQKIQTRIDSLNSERTAAEAAALAYYNLSERSANLWEMIKYDDYLMHGTTRAEAFEEAVGYVQAYVAAYGGLEGLTIPVEDAKALFDGIGQLKSADEISSSAESVNALMAALQALDTFYMNKGDAEQDVIKQTEAEIRASSEALSIAREASANSATEVADLKVVVQSLADGTSSVSDSAATANEAINGVQENAEALTAEPYTAELDADDKATLVIDKLTAYADAFAQKEWFATIGFTVAGGIGGALAQIGKVAGIPGFADGLDYVPYDNYLAYLHKGEMVLTAEQAAALRQMSDMNFAGNLASRAFLAGNDPRPVQAGETIVQQTIHFHQPVQTPDEFAKTMKLYATYGLTDV